MAVFDYAIEVCLAGTGIDRRYWHFKDKRFINQLLSPASQTNNTLCEYRELVFPSHPCAIVNIDLHLKDKTFTNQLLPWWFDLAIMLLFHTRLIRELEVTAY